MSNRIIDERVVKMEFDNGKFEQNAQASLRTIDKLKEALKFENADKGFSKIEDAAGKINLNKLDKNIQAIANRFSMMGIIGDQVMRNLTTSVMKGIGKMQRLLAAPIAQMINGGKARAMNIANAEFSLKGLGIDWKAESEEFEVAAKHLTDEEQRVLKETGKFADSLYKDIDYAVSGTAYGLDEAAKAASILATSNVAIGDEMRTALRGISGVAAMTNRSYTEISNIFTHVAGKNKLQTEELNMLAERGLGAASKLGEYLGKSETEIKEMVGKGQIDFKTFAAAMDDAFGEHAKDANNTFNGALSNMKAALSRIGADIAGPFFDACIKPFNEIRRVIDNLRVALQPLIKDVNYAIGEFSKVFSYLIEQTGLVTDSKLSLDKMPKLTKTIENLEWAFMNVAYAISQVIKPFRIAFVEVFQPTGDIFVKMSAALRSFTEKLRLTGTTQKALYSVFKAVFKVLKAGFKIIGSITKVVAKLVDFLSPVIIIGATIIELIADVILNLLEGINVIDLLNIAINAVITILQTIAQVIAGVIGIIVMAIAAFVNWIAQLNIINPIIETFNKALEFLTQIGVRVTTALSDFFKLFQIHIPFIKQTTSATEEMAGVLGERLGPELEEETDQFNKAGEAAKEYKNIFEQVADAIGNAIQKVTGKVKDFYEGSNPIGLNWLNALKNFKLSTIIDAAAEVVDYISEIDLSFEGITKAVVEAYNNLMDYLGLTQGKVDWNKVFKIAQAAGLLAVAKTGLDIANKTATVASGIVKSVQKVSDAVANYLSAEAFAKRVSAFQDICKGILLLSASIVLVSLVREDKLWSSVKAIGVLVAVCGAIMEAIKYFDKKFIPVVVDGGASTLDKIIGGIKKIASALATSVSIVGIGASIFMISGALWLLAGAFITWHEILSNPDIKVQETVSLLGGLLGGLALLIGVTSVITVLAPATGAAMMSLAATVFAVVFAMYGLIGAIWLFNNINWQDYTQGLQGVAEGIGLMLSAALGAIYVTSAMGGGKGVGLVLIGLALSLYALAHACEVLSKVPFGGMMQGLFGIALYLTGLVTAMHFLNKSGVFANPRSMGQWVGIAFAIMSIAYACMETAKVIEKLTSLGTESLIGFIEILGIYIVMGKTMEKIGQAAPAAGPILAMAIVIGAICAALSWIALYDWPDIWKAIVYLGVCMAEAAGVMFVASKVDNKTWMPAVAMAGMILSIAISLSLLSKLSIPKVLAAIIELGAAIAIIGLITKKVTGFSANWRAMLSFGAIIVALGAAMWALSTIDDPTKVLKVAGAMAIVMAAVAASLIAVSKLGSKNISIADNKKLILTMVAMIGAVGGAIFLLTKFGGKDIEKKAIPAALSMAILMAALAGVFAALNLIPEKDTKKDNGTLWAALGVLAVAGLVMHLLTGFGTDLSKALEASLGVAALMLAVVGVYAAINLIPSQNENGDVKKLAGAVAVVAVLALIIGALTSAATNLDKAIQAAVAMVILTGAVIALYAAFLLIPSNGEFGEMAGVAVVTIFIIGLLSVILWRLSEIPANKVDAVTKLMDPLIKFCLLYAGLIVVLSIVSYVAAGAASGIMAGIVPIAIISAIIVAVIAAIAGLAFLIGTVSNAIEKLTGDANGNGGFKIIDQIKSGFDILVAIVDGIGRMIAALGTSIQNAVAEGVIETIINGITKIADGITKIINALQPALDSVAGYQDNGAIDGLKTLSEVIATMATVGFFTSDFISMILGLKYDGLANKFSQLGAAIVAFNNSIAGTSFDIAAIEDSQKAAQSIGDLIDILQNYVDLEQKLLGFSDIKTLGDNLAYFGEALVKYNNTVSDCEWNLEAIGNAKKTAGDLVAINNTLNPLKDGFKTFSDIGTFGEQLSSFTGYLVDFMNQITATTWDNTKVESACSTAERLAAMGASFDERGGLDSLFHGEKESLSKFGERISSLGYYIGQFSNNVKDVDTAKCTVVTTLLETIADACLRIVESQGKFGNLTLFRQEIGWLGDALKTFNDSVVDLDTAQITVACIAFEKILGVMNKIAESGDAGAAITQFMTDVENLGSISFDKFISAFSSNETASKVEGALNNMLAALSTKDMSFHLDKMYVMGQKLVAKLVDGMGSEKAISKIQAGMSSVLREIKAALSSNEDTGSEGVLNKTGAEMLKAIGDGFSDAKAVETFTTTIVNVIKNSLGQAYLDLSLLTLSTFGKNIVSGIADAINTQSNASIIATAIQAVVDQAVSAISVNVGINVNTAVSGGVSSVLGDQLEPQLQNKGMLLNAAVNSTTTAVSNNAVAAQNKAQQTVSNNAKKNNDQYNKAADTRAAENQRAEQLRAKQQAKAIEQSAQTVTEAQNKSTEKAQFDVLTEIGSAIKTGTSFVTDKVGNAVKQLGDSVGVDMSGLENSVGDSIEDMAGGTLENIFGEYNKTKEEGDKLQDDIEKGISDAGKGIGDAAAGAGKSAGGGAKAGGDAFVASYSEFWQNVYAVHALGMQGFEQRLETFEKWQENTLKKTQDIVDKYKNAMEDAKKEAASGLFEEVAERNEEVTKEKLKKNLEDQVNQIKEFNNIILQLRTRLMGTNLFDAITEMGVDSIDELRALNSMTDTELSEYANLYDQKYLASFQGIQQKAQSELSNLYGGMAVNIDQFAATFDGSLQSIEGYFSAQAEAVKAAAAPLGQNLTAGMAEGMTNPEAMQALTEAGNKINTDFVNMESGTLAAQLGEHSPSEFTKPHGENLTLGIAEGMTDEVAQEGLATAATKLMGLILEKLDTAFNEGGMTDKLSIFGEQLTNTITSAVQASSLEGGVDGGGSAIYMAGASVLTDFLNGLNSKREEITTKISTLMSTISNEIKGAANKLKFKTAGTELFKAMMKGFEMGWFGGNGEGKGEGEEGYGAKIIKKIMTKIIKNLKEYKGGEKGGKSLSFYKTGQEFIKGLINGLKSKEGELYKAVEEIVKKAIQAANAAAQTHSPSKLTTETGMYMGMGLVNGINSMSGAVSLAAASITEEALNGFRSISEVLGGLEDFDATPVIAPIMDLTGIQNGISTMGNMLNNANSYEVAASINGSLEAQRVAKLNEMTNLRRAMDSITSSNSLRSNEMLQLQSAVNSLNSTINGQTTPDYTQLQASINNLNSAMAGVTTGNTVNVSPTFNIQSNDPEAVAEEVNKALQDMVNRRSAVWA